MDFTLLMNPRKHYKRMIRCRVVAISRDFWSGIGVWSFSLSVMMVMAGCVFEPQAGPVVVVVGDRHITALAFKKEMAFAREDLPVPSADKSRINKRLLDQMIDRWLMLVYAKRKHLVISDEAFRRYVNALKSGYSARAFQKALVRSHMTPDMWERRVREDLLIHKAGESISQGIEPPSYEEMKAYFEAHRGQFMMPEMVRFRQVVCEDRSLAKKLRKRILAGEDMADLAVRYASVPKAAQGGEVGWVPKGILNEGLEKVLFSLPPGQISPVVEGPYGYHVFKILARRDKGLHDFATVIQEIEQRILAQRKADLCRQWLKQLRAEIPVRINRQALLKMELS